MLGRFLLLSALLIPACLSLSTYHFGSKEEQAFKNGKFMSCCEENGVTDQEIKSFCSYDVLRLGEDLKNIVADASSWLRYASAHTDLMKLLQCAGNGVDNTECCKGKGIP